MVALRETGSPAQSLSIRVLWARISEALLVGLPAVFWAEAEVIGLKYATSGHAYFSLRDHGEEASIDCVIFRNAITATMRSVLVEGARVRARCRLTTYVLRGRIQLQVDRVDPAGQGALLQFIEEQKELLKAEGVFAAERKRPLPLLPRTVGVVSSPSGAVIHDIIKVSFRRGNARLLLCPALVQGEGAVSSIVSALHLLARVAEVDVIIVARGGGSFEDLLPFQDARVVRAIASCRVPVVSAVGHQTDVTLADLAADVRAATPSEAAEMCVAGALELRERVVALHARMARAMDQSLVVRRARIEKQSMRLRDPRLLLAHMSERLDALSSRLERAMQHKLVASRRRGSQLAVALEVQHPRARLVRSGAALSDARSRLVRAIQRNLGRTRERFSELVATLSAISPLSVLARGYAIALTENGTAIRSSSDVSPGETIRVRTERALLRATVVSREDCE